MSANKVRKVPRYLGDETSILAELETLVKREMADVEW